MIEAPGRRKHRTALGLACALVLLSGCGQRGALYMPDRNARVITRPAGSSAPVNPSSAPADSQPQRP